MITNIHESIDIRFEQICEAQQKALEDLSNGTIDRKAYLEVVEERKEIENELLKRA